MIRVLVVNDPSMLAASVRGTLEADRDIAVVGEVSDGQSALKALSCDVAG